MGKTVTEVYLRRLVRELQNSGCDAILLAPSEDLKFFTGYSPMNCERFQGFFLTKEGKDFYFCNLLYADEMRAAYQGKVPVYSWFDGDGMLDALGDVLKAWDLLGKRILVNSAVKAFHILEIRKAFHIDFANGSEILEEVRIRKNEEELSCLRKAAQIADRAFEDVVTFIRPGLLESEIQAFLIKRMECYGGVDAGAMTASGPNAGYPHYCGGKRAVKEGDMIILDYGCLYKGLHSDMSRTVFVQRIPEKWAEIYDIVDIAQKAGQEAVREGAYIPDIDFAARTIIEKAGYADFFPYRLGHGIGYCVHEEPYIHGNNLRKLERGMVFSIEPGIYLPGEGGVRIENIVAVNNHGEREILNQAKREKVICGK